MAGPGVLLSMAGSRVEELRRRLERDPASRLFAQLAEEHRKAGDHGEAIRIARAGLAVHPVYPSARLTLGRALLESGDAAAARVELEEALRQAPDNILASRFLGQTLEALGDVAAAVRQYRATLQMTPADQELAAHVRELTSPPSEPLAPPPLPLQPAAPPPAPAGPPAVAAGAGPSPSPPAMAAEASGGTAAPFSSSTLAELYLRQGLSAQALEVYRRVVAEDPGNERARRRIAEIEGSLAGDAVQARRRAIERAIAELEALLGVIRRRQ
ncbi:MAG TPA: tetratricopeptide repeat protein [Vicinamibacteria bacterium]|nr:tetratricopeptide repeat protein [Vicinamibacteria bacterium]